MKANECDYQDYLELAQTAAPIRAERRVSIADFNRMASEPITVILDTRSKRDYEKWHIKGALHLNFADLNKSTLAERIPDPNTRPIYQNQTELKDDFR